MQCQLVWQSPLGKKKGQFVKDRLRPACPSFDYGQGIISLSIVRVHYGQGIISLSIVRPWRARALVGAESAQTAQADETLEGSNTHVGTDGRALTRVPYELKAQTSQKSFYSSRRHS